MSDNPALDPQPSPSAGKREPVWKYRGYELDAGNFTTAMVHLFRAEISRANVWRQRLDATTNWAVITTGATISVSFTETAISPLIIVLNTILITLFLSIEARRYRYYELWSHRVRLMETDFFAAMLVPPFKPSADWSESMAESLLHPDFPISVWEAFGRRLRRNFTWMYAVLAASLLLKTWLHPTPAEDLGVFLARSDVGSIPGWVILSIGGAFNVGLLLIGLLTARLHKSSGEVLPRFAAGSEGRGSGRRPWFRSSRRRRQFLALIISDKQDEVSQKLIEELERGVTALAAEGMYTHAPHSVLLCAVTVTEVPQLKALVKAIDPNAFVVVAPVHEVLGRGFAPLQEE